MRTSENQKQSLHRAAKDYLHYTQLFLLETKG